MALPPVVYDLTTSLAGTSNATPNDQVTGVVGNAFYMGVIEGSNPYIYGHGFLDEVRWKWLQDELDAGQANNQLMVIVQATDSDDDRGHEENHLNVFGTSDTNDRFSLRSTHPMRPGS